MPQATRRVTFATNMFRKTKTSVSNNAPFGLVPGVVERSGSVAYNLPFCKSYGTYKVIETTRTLSMPPRLYCVTLQLFGVAIISKGFLRGVAILGGVAMHFAVFGNELITNNLFAKLSKKFSPLLSF